MHRRTFPVSARVLTLAVTVMAGGCGDQDAHGPLGPSQMGATSAEVRMGMPGMGGMQLSSEFAYLAEMIPHHEEAIVTARLLLAGTRRQEMRDFARAIIDGQSAEVAQMRAWLEVWYRGRDASVAYVPMMRDLTGLTGDALDQAFLEDMIPHHMRAVMMSQQVLARDLAIHAEVVPFATTIRDVQQREIQQMQAWRAAWFR